MVIHDCIYTYIYTYIIHINIYIHIYTCVRIFIYIYIYSSNLNCWKLFASWLKYNIHIHTLIHVHTSTHTHTKYTHTHTTYTHTYVARSLTHIHTHARTHTTQRHATLLTRHAVAPAASVVVLFREVQLQALRCSGARALTKTQGKAGRSATPAYTMHGKNRGSLNAAFVCVGTAINGTAINPTTRRVEGGTHVMAHLMITATSETGQADYAWHADWPRTGATRRLPQPPMGLCGDNDQFALANPEVKFMSADVRFQVQNRVSTRQKRMYHENQVTWYNLT